MSFANRYHWTPDQVNALDPEFIDHLLAFQNAEADEAEKQKKDAAKRHKPGSLRGRGMARDV